MTAKLRVSGLQVHIRIKLQNAYGRFAKRWADVDREILSVALPMPNGESYDGDFITADDFLRQPERNSDGSVLLFHVYRGPQTSDGGYYSRTFPVARALKTQSFLTILLSSPCRYRYSNRISTNLFYF